MKAYVEFIVKNCEKMTVKELEKETGIANSYIRSILAKKGLSAKKVVAKKPYYVREVEACPITGFYRL
jgi:hypothetical protein